jgi:hypothetical protein
MIIFHEIGDVSWQLKLSSVRYQQCMTKKKQKHMAPINDRAKRNNRKRFRNAAMPHMLRILLF